MVFSSEILTCRRGDFCNNRGDFATLGHLQELQSRPVWLEKQGKGRRQVQIDKGDRGKTVKVSGGEEFSLQLIAREQQEYCSKLVRSNF